MNSSVFSELGLAKMPWVVRAYIFLLLVFTFLLVFSAMDTGLSGAGATREVIESLPRTKLFSLASDGLKTVLGALLGSLSLAAERRLGRDSKPSVERRKAE